MKNTAPDHNYTAHILQSVCWGKKEERDKTKQQQTKTNKQNRRCTADMQRKPQFHRRRKHRRDNSSYRPRFGVAFQGPHFRQGSELSVRPVRERYRHHSFPHQLLRVSANGTGQNPTSRHQQSGEKTPTLLQMKKQMWQKCTRAGKRDRWLERARDRSEGKEIYEES